MTTSQSTWTCGNVCRFGAPRSVNHAPDDSGDDGEYDADLTADQKMAMRELQEMKLDLAYAGDVRSKLRK